MPDLNAFDLPATIQNSVELGLRAKQILAEFDRKTTIPYQEQLRHILDYMIGELEKSASAASRSQALKVAAATRNLFEAKFVVEYVCTSDENMDRFILDASIDELEIMKKFQTTDEQAPAYVPDHASQERMQALEAQIASANLPGKQQPLQAKDIAEAVSRKPEYDAWYKVYSKMTHATAWAILGRCNWDKMTLLLLLKSNLYAAECISALQDRLSHFGQNFRETTPS